MDNDNTVPAPVVPLYAVCLSASQFKEGLKVTAQLSFDDGTLSIDTKIQWAELPHLNAQDNPGLWLYGLLSQLIQNFDDHVVEVGAVEPSTLPKAMFHG